MVLISPGVDPVGRFIGAIGSDSFGAAYHALTRANFGVNRCHVFSFADRARPICVLAQASWSRVAKSAQTLASDYVGGDYHYDPLLCQLKKVPAGGVWMARTQAKSSDSRGFHAKYYDGSGLADEIALFCETGHELLYAGFCRQENERPFSDAESRLIMAGAKVLLNSIARHLEILRLRERLDASAQTMPDTSRCTVEEKQRHYFAKVRDALLASGCGLTAREAEICAYIVQGYFAKAIAGKLGISVDTVGTHRKHAYAKLGVSRQNELFGRYVNLLTSTQSAPILS